MAANDFHYRRLGRTDYMISPIGLGVMQFSGGKGIFRFMFPDLSQEDMNRIVRKAIDGGVNFFDTAEMYGGGRSERGLALALDAAGKKDGEVIIGTKWFPVFRTARSIPRTIDKRIHSLNGYSIDLYMVHQPWGFSSTETEMNAMADLVEEGKIQSVGVSNFDEEGMRRAHAALAKRGLPLAVNQVQYNLIHRTIEDNGVLEAARELGVTIVAWGPLASGLLTGKFHGNPELLRGTPPGRRMSLQREIETTRPLIDRMRTIGARYGATISQVALNWLIHSQGENVVAIPGASSSNQAEDSAGAMNFILSGEDINELDSVSREVVSQ